MCAGRYWKTIETFPFDESVNIIGTRSDGLIVTSQATFESGTTATKIVSKVVSAMKVLNSYKNCKCTSDDKCEKHK